MIPSSSRFARYGREKPSGPGTGPGGSARGDRAATATERARRWTLLLFIALFLTGMVMSGGVHEFLHDHDHEDDHEDEGGDCLICHLTGLDRTIEPKPRLDPVALAPASPPRIDEPESRTERSGARPRAPPAA